MKTEDLIAILGRTDPFALLGREALAPFCLGIMIGTFLLKDALSALTQLQKRISKGFHVPWMNYFSQ